MKKILFAVFSSVFLSSCSQQSMPLEEDTNSNSDEITFDDCGVLSNYVSQPWYEEFASKATSLTREQRSVSNEGTVIKEIPATLIEVSDSCYSENGNIFISLIPGAYFSGPSIYRFDTENFVLEKAKFEDHGAKGLASPDEFGKRTGNIIELIGTDGDAGLEVTMYYEYNFTENTLELTGY